MPMAARKDASSGSSQDREVQQALVVQNLAAAGFQTLRPYLNKARPDSAGSGAEYRCLHADFAVTAIAYSSEGRYVLAGGEDISNDETADRDERHALRLLEVETGEEIGRFRGHSSAVTCVAFAPQAPQAASASRGGTLHVWNTIFRKSSFSFCRPESPVLSLAFSADGQRLLTGSEDCVVRVWDLQSGERLSRCEGHTAAVTAVAWFRDGRIASASLDQSVRVWDGATGSPLHCWQGHAGGVRSIAVAPDGSLVLSGGHDKLLRLWNVQLGQEAGSFPCPSECVASVAFSPDGARVLAGESDGIVRLWDLKGRQELCCFSGHSRGVTSVAFAPATQHAASGSLDQTVRVWTLPSPFAHR
jgi:WD40 repeat protein